jgi:hypothetical protein
LRVERLRGAVPRVVADVDRLPADGVAQFVRATVARGAVENAEPKNRS